MSKFRSLQFVKPLLGIVSSGLAFYFIYNSLNHYSPKATDRQLTRVVRPNIGPNGACISALSANRSIASELTPVANVDAEIGRTKLQGLNQLRQAITQAYARHEVADHFRFGFESEYTLDNWSSRLLDVYAPAPELGISLQEWMALRPTQKNQPDGRIVWLKKNLKRIFPEKRKTGALLRLDVPPELAFLPERLVLDFTGNLEIILPPLRSFAEWHEKVTLINQNFGPGSMQSTLGIPRSEFFNGAPEIKFKEHVGYFQFIADYDVMLKLMQAYEKFLEAPDKAHAKSFEHPFLGPFNRIKREHLERVLRSQVQGKGFDEQTRIGIAYMDSSFKYIGSTTYRPDLGAPNFVVAEVRDAHSSYEILREKVMRTIFDFSSDRTRYVEAFNLIPFDSVNDFKKFTPSTREALAGLVPSKFIEPGVEYTMAEKISHQTYRNFAFPLRNWSAHLELFGSRGLRRNVEKAQRDYLRTIEETAAALWEKKITKEEALVRIHAALVQFPFQSGILEAMLKWQANGINAVAN